MDFVRRIPVDIFEKWYADQDIYCKITHIPTAEELEKDYIFEYKQSIGKFEVPQCTTIKELIEHCHMIVEKYIDLFYDFEKKVVG